MKTASRNLVALKTRVVSVKAYKVRAHNVAAHEWVIADFRGKK